MNKYKITIKTKDGLFLDKELTGEFTAQSESDAIEQAKEHYAMELGTFDDNIEIIKTVIVPFENELLKLDVYDERFLIAFANILEKFVNEYDDMAQMEAIKKAKELLDILNDK